MKKQNFMNFWVLSSEGTQIFQFSQSHENLISPELLNGFFSGLLQFVVDLNGGGFYHLFVENSIFIGIQSKNDVHSPYYLILQIREGSRRQINNIRKHLEKIGDSICSLPDEISHSLSVMEKQIHSIIAKSKFFRKIL